MDFQKQSDCLWMRSGCTNLYKFMLRGKNKAFWSTCTAIFYFDTNIGHPAGTTIREKTEIVDILQVLDETLKIMKEDGELLGLQEFYYGILLFFLYFILNISFLFLQMNLSLKIHNFFKIVNARISNF